MRKIFIISMLACVFVACQNHPESLLDSLNTAARQGYCYFGQEDATVYGHEWTSWQSSSMFNTLASDFRYSDMYSVSGKRPAVVGFDLGGIETASSLNIDSVPFVCIREAAIAQLNEGGIVTFSWHPMNPITMNNAWDTTAVSQASIEQIEAIIDPWLDNIADFLSSIFSAVPATNQRIIFRPWHEHTGWWFWWGNLTLTKEQYISLFQYTYSKLSTLNGQMLWAYSPNLGVDKQGYMERYPGDKYVDVLGFDCYQFSDDPTDYMRALDSTLKFMTELGRERNKPIALTETGRESLRNPQWWTQVLLPAVEPYPISYLMVWRNAYNKPEHFYAPFKGEPSVDDFKQFLKNRKIKTL